MARRQLSRGRRLIGSLSVTQSREPALEQGRVSKPALLLLEQGPVLRPVRLKQGRALRPAHLQQAQGVWKPARLKRVQWRLPPALLVVIPALVQARARLQDKTV